MSYFDEGTSCYVICPEMRKCRGCGRYEDTRGGYCGHCIPLEVAERALAEIRRAERICVRSRGRAS